MVSPCRPLCRKLDRVEVREIKYGSAEYETACVLRNELLREPLGLSLFDEDLTRESDYVHLAGFEEGELIGYLQLRPLDDSVVKMQQVAVSETCQGQGHGRQLVAASEQMATERGYSEIVLHARETVIGFYEKLGYERRGERFEEVGISHFKAGKQLR